MARVWAASQHSGTHLLMLLAIADFADDDGRAYPAVSTLATKCRMRSRNANVILAALRASGELQVKAGQGPRGTNLYRVNLPAEGLQNLAPLQSLAPLQGNAAPPAKACSKPLQAIADKPSMNHQEPPVKKRERAKRATPAPTKCSVPDGFGVSSAVQAWAASKGFHQLPEHLEAFVGKCKAKGYQYADWDAAFMEAIRKDWAGLRTGQQPNGKPPLADLTPAAQRRLGIKAPRSFDAMNYREGIDKDGNIT